MGWLYSFDADRGRGAGMDMGKLVCTAVLAGSAGSTSIGSSSACGAGSLRRFGLANCGGGSLGGFFLPPSARNSTTATPSAIVTQMAIGNQAALFLDSGSTSAG